MKRQIQCSQTHDYQRAIVVLGTCTLPTVSSALFLSASGVNTIIGSALVSLVGAAIVGNPIGTVIIAVPEGMVIVIVVLALVGRKQYPKSTQLRPDSPV